MLAPAHVTIRMRRSLGLPETVGLLVRHVDAGSRAERAGLKVGDVLVRSGDRELRSATSLYAALHESLSTGEAPVTAVRGVDTTLEMVLDLRRALAGPQPLPGPGDAHDHATHAL